MLSKVKTLFRYLFRCVFRKKEEGKARLDISEAPMLANNAISTGFHSVAAATISDAAKGTGAMIVRLTTSEVPNTIK